MPAAETKYLYSATVHPFTATVSVIAVPAFCGDAGESVRLASVHPCAVVADADAVAVAAAVGADAAGVGGAVDTGAEAGVAAGVAAGTGERSTVPTENIIATNVSQVDVAESDALTQVTN